MAIINLRDYYPFYTSDCFMVVSEEVAEMFKEFDRKEAEMCIRDSLLSFWFILISPYIIVHFGLDYENVMKFYIK